MTPERWQKVKLILEEAIEAEPTERSSLLDKHCGTDRELRTEVESLLNLHNSTDEGLEQDAYSTLFASESGSLSAGENFGKYKILREIGSGGMGSVFLAERSDSDFEQKVAIKIIRLGLHSDDLRRRFIRERQILASLEHPNIARLIDGGTTDDGVPFLVMEYVEGTPIIAYATKRDLSLAGRLDLFREVCSAVSFAHQKLVIHRDLKPLNILITNDGKAKLLDFGIAKLVKSDASEETRTHTFAFTPEYASPEQIRGENLSTSTDIYSLGVILYELLTGSRPFYFENKNLGEIVSTATLSEPSRPSASIGDRTIISSSLKGDLDNIILKALQKSPERRYSSVEQFSEDISRHVKGLPVFARPDTWTYRAEKFTRRNTLFVGAAALSLVILIGGVLTTGYQAGVANIERQKAENRFNDVRTLANSFMFEINEEIMRSPVKARELLVQRAIEYLDKLAAESAGNLELKSELAEAYQKIGEVQSDLFRPFVGKTSEAVVSQQKALRLREEVFADEPTETHAVNVAVSHQKLGNVLLTSGKIGEATEHYSLSVKILEAEIERDPMKTDTQRSLARSYSMLGQAIVRSGSLKDALRNYESSLKIFRELSGKDPENNLAQRSVGIVLSYIGFVKMEMGEINAAVDNYAQWLEIEKQLVARDPNNIDIHHDLSSAYVWNGVMLSDQGQIPQARAHFSEAIRIQQQILAADKESVGVAYSLADCYLEFGKAMVRNKQPEIAIENLKSALGSYQTIFRKDEKNLMMRHRIANAQRFLADAYFQKNNIAEAQQNYDQAHDVFKELTEFDPLNLDWLQDLGMSYTRRGELSLKQIDKPAARSNFELALPIFEKLVAAVPDNIKRKAELENIRQHLIRSQNN